MAPAKILKYPTASPSDTTPFQRLVQDGHDKDSILGVIGKTEGNGCVNDFSRTLASHVWDALIPESAISIFSGGTEGVLSPHVSFIVKAEERTGLRAVVGHTRKLQAWEVGTLEHTEVVERKVTEMMNSEGISKEDVALVLIKCPLLTSDRVMASRAAGHEVVTTDTYESMAYSRYASAIGIAAALDDLGNTNAAHALASGDCHTAKASCSSGAELEDCHILVLANDSSIMQVPPTTLLQAFSSVMATAIDFASLQSLLNIALHPTSPYKQARLVQVFAKAEADPSGMVAGRFRHTMLTDSDLHSTRHARAAVGGLIAGVTGDCCVYVSGGAEGQGPKGGGQLCVVVEWRV